MSWILIAKVSGRKTPNRSAEGWFCWFSDNWGAPVIELHPWHMKVCEAALKALLELI